MNKLTIGSQWKCRDGHRAVVVQDYNSDDDTDTSILCWFSKTDETWWVDNNGKSTGEGMGSDLLTPWTEPKMGEFYCSVYMDEDGTSWGATHPVKENSNKNTYPNSIACVRVTWTEGQFDE